MSNTEHDSILSQPAAPSLVVGIGASAGGVEALQAFFAHMPADSGCAYVVILHLSPEHTSNLAAILQSVTPLPVSPVTAQVQIAPDHVYVVSPKQRLTLVDGALAALRATSPAERWAPIDMFFRALADAYDDRGVCVVLSGSGADGSLGLKRVKERGGAVFVQQPDEAAFAEMPRSAIATDLVDAVLPAVELPARIVAYGARATDVTSPEEPERRPPDQEQALRELFALLRTRTNHDFSAYKRHTLLRRIARRITIHDLPDLSAYVAHLRAHPEETQSLLKDLLISVTSFFRDPEAFAILEQQILPRLFAGRRSDDTLRLWVAGCATGEEAYSLAMLCAEHSAGLRDAPRVQIFATDIDESALARARAGVYTAADTADLSPERLRRFFIEEQGRYRVRPDLRERILFASHNLLTDPPFSQLDLISCRNLLIYLDRDAQERALETFHFALNADSVLFLGSTETAVGTSGLFVPINREQRLFQRHATAARILPRPWEGALAQLDLPMTLVAAEAQERVRERLHTSELHRLLLEQYAPPSLVVDANLALVHLSERAGRYLQIRGGEPTNDLLTLIRPELRTALRTALFQARQRRTPVEAPNLTVRIDERSEQLTLHVRPVLRPDDPARGFLLVLFAPQGGAPLVPSEPVVPSDAALVRQQEENQWLGQQLRSSSEQYEVQAEELRAANEELQALNEELRTAAEEQTTSREELQSVNEELRTVNQELKVKVEEAIQTSADLQNLVNATDIATIFLDRQLRIKRFTPAAQRLFNLIALDQGRPLADITHRLQDVNVLADAEQVYATLQTVEREVRAFDGRAYVLRALPYRVGDDRIGGVMLTFFDITARVQAEQALRASEEQFRRAIEEAPIPVIMHAEDGEVLQISRSWTELTGYTLADVPTFDAWLSQAYGEGAEAVRNHVRALFAGEVRALNIAFTIRTRTGELRHWSFSASSSGALGDGRRFIVGMAVDVTEQQRAEDTLRTSEARYRALVTASSYTVYRMSPDWSEMLQLDGQGFIVNTDSPSASWMDVYIHPDDQPTVLMAIQEAVRGKHMFALEHRVRRVDGSLGWTLSRAVPLLDERGAIVEWFGAASDVTARKEAEESRRANDERFRTLFAMIDEAFALCEIICDPGGAPIDYRLLEVNPAFEQMTGITPAAAAGRTARELVLGIEAWWIETYGRVALQGEAIRFENHVAEMGRWFDAYATPVGEPGNGKFALVFKDITERKRHEHQQEYLLRLGEALRSSADALALYDAVTQLVMEHFGSDRCYYCTIEGGTAIVHRDARRGELPSVAGTYPLESMPIFQAIVNAGRPIVVQDAATTGILDENLRQLCIELGVISFIDVPVVKSDRVAGVLCITQSTPRAWSDRDIELAIETAERTWAAAERARAEETMRESEGRLRQLVEHLPGGAAFIVDRDLRYLLAGGEALRAAGFEPQAFIGKTIFEVLAPELAASYEPNYRQALAGEPFLDEHVAHGASFITRGTPLRNAGGDVYAVLVVSYDISSRKRAEEALRESEVRFRTVTDAVSQVIWTNDTQGKAIYFNQRWYAYSGLTYDQSVGLGWQAIVHPDDAQAARARWDEARATGAVFESEYRLRREDGAYRWHLGRNVPLRDAGGAIIGWFGSATDIEDLKQAEAARHESATLRRLAEAQEEERLRIARDLHDQLGQLITGLLLRLKQVEETAHGTPVAAQLPPVQDLAQDLAREAHRIAVNLRPTALEDVGLVPALERLLEDWSRQAGIPSAFQSHGFGTKRVPRPCVLSYPWTDRNREPVANQGGRRIDQWPPSEPLLR